MTAGGRASGKVGIPLHLIGKFEDAVRTRHKKTMWVRWAAEGTGERKWYVVEYFGKNRGKPTANLAPVEPHHEIVLETVHQQEMQPNNRVTEELVRRVNKTLKSRGEQQSITHQTLKYLGRRGILASVATNSPAVRRRAGNTHTINVKKSVYRINRDRLLGE
jgi:hypothetical protein